MPPSSRWKTKESYGGVLRGATLLEVEDQRVGRVAPRRTPPSTRGVVLLGALIILLTISLIGATLASFFFSVNTVAEVELSRAQALYLAEAGISDAIYQLRQGGMSGDTEQHAAAKALGEGDYEVEHDAAAGLITSTGRVRGVRRIIQVKYLPF